MPSACYFVVSASVVVTMYVLRMSSMARFLGTIARASLCLHLTFLWRRRCMLWIDFCTDNKLNGNKDISVSARRFALPSAIMTS